MPRCRRNLASAKGVKVPGSPAACVLLEYSVSRVCLCMLLGLVAIAAGVHSVEEGQDCMVDKGVVWRVPCLFLAEVEAELMTKVVMR